MTALYVVGGVIAYFVVGAIVVGIGYRWWTRRLGRSQIEAADDLFLGVLVVVWPLLWLIFAFAGMCMASGEIVKRVSAFGRKGP